MQGLHVGTRGHEWEQATVTRSILCLRSCTSNVRHRGPKEHSIGNGLTEGGSGRCRSVVFDLEHKEGTRRVS